MGFDELLTGRDTFRIKWNVPEGELPMHMADLDFATAPAIVEAVREIAASGQYSYTSIPRRWRLAYKNWWESRYGITFDEEEFVFAIGVVAALSSVIRRLTQPAEKIVVIPPVTDNFYVSVRNNGRVVVESPLRYTGSGYALDLEDLESKLSDPQATMLLFCNPQNPPVGEGTWSREELQAIGELCRKHHVQIVSDEIHCDLTDPGTTYVPFASVSAYCREQVVTLAAPSKSFGIPGLRTAAVIVKDPLLRHRIWRGLNNDEVAEPNVFAIAAAIAAYEKSGAWLDELRAYLKTNKDYVHAFLGEKLPEVPAVISAGTYLVWLDLRAYQKPGEEIARVIRERTGLIVSSGSAFGTGGEGFVRMSLSAPLSQVQEGMARLEKALRQN